MIETSRIGTSRKAAKVLMAIALSLAILAAILLAMGVNPVHAARSLIRGALGSPFGIGETLTITSLLIMTALAAVIPFSGGLWNIGGEGQLYAGAVLATVIAFTLPSGVPSWLHVILCLLGGLLGGAIWGLIPAILKVRLGVNEVITTLMLVYVAMYMTDGVINHIWPSSGQTTPPIPTSAMATQIVPGLSVTWASAIVILAVPAVWFLLRRTQLGYSIRITGDNVRAAQLGGINPNRVRVSALSLGGAMAGGAGAILVVGINGSLISGFSANFGYIGIAVALMAGLSPLWTVGAAFLFAVLRVGANQMQVTTGLNPSSGDVLVTVFVLTLLAFHVLRVRQLGSIRT